MSSHHPSKFVLSVLLPSLVFLFIAQTVCLATPKEKKAYAMTEVEFQSELMNFSDRFASLITGRFENYETTKPPPQARQFIRNDLVFSMSSMYTTATGPNP